MEQLLLKNFEILNNIKNEYDKLIEENKSLKEENKSLKEQLNHNMDENLKNDKRCYARVITNGNGGWFNFNRCDCPKVNENYCNEHIKNLKDGDVRYVGSKNLPFRNLSSGDKMWAKKMEELFPNVYFTGENILDLTKYDIYGNSVNL